MNVVLLTGRAGSKSITKKNLMPVLGRPLAMYAMLSAQKAPSIDKVCLSTDCPDLTSLAADRGIQVIPRPSDISGDRSELVLAIEHALEYIARPVELLVTMHCNSGTHRPGLVEECLQVLRDDPELDSCVTGSIDRSVHPFRTRRVTSEGFLEPWFEIPAETSSNRQTMDGCFILDGTVRAMRVANCFPPRGDQPFPYLGKKIRFVENDGGRDVHCAEDVFLTESYLRSHGFSEDRLPTAWESET